MEQNLERNGEKTGVLGVFGSMLTGIGRAIIKSEISSKNNAFQSDLLELSKAAEDTDVIKMYAELSESLSDCADIVEELYSQGIESFDDESFYALMWALRNLLVDLFNQVLKCSQYDIEDEAACVDYLHKIRFWANMFNDGNNFYQLYPYHFLRKMPEMWKKIILVTDGLLELDEREEREESFRNVIYDFARNICADTEEIAKLCEKESLGDEDEERGDELFDDMRSYTDRFLSVLDRAIDSLEYEPEN